MKLGCKNVGHLPWGAVCVCICGWVVISSVSALDCPSCPPCCGLGSWVLASRVWTACAGFHLPVGAFNDQLKALHDRTVGHIREHGSCRSLEPCVTATSLVCSG